MDQKHAAVAIIPCLDLDASQAFYERLGFAAASVYPAHGYRSCTTAAARAFT